MSEVLDLRDYRKVILGEVWGVGLRARGPNDTSIVVEILSGDDGCWYRDSHGCSVYWLDDMQTVLRETRAWLELNCEKQRVGYRFREEKKDE